MLHLKNYDSNTEISTTHIKYTTQRQSVTMRHSIVSGENARSDAYIDIYIYIYYNVSNRNVDDSAIQHSLPQVSHKKVL